MDNLKEYLEIETLKEMTYTEINTLLNKLNSQVAKLEHKAIAYDALDLKVAELYSEDSEADLVDVGELVATELGYL